MTWKCFALNKIVLYCFSLAYNSYNISYSIIPNMYAAIKGKWLQGYYPIQSILQLRYMTGLHLSAHPPILRPKQAAYNVRKYVSTHTKRHKHLIVIESCCLVLSLMQHGTELTTESLPPLRMHNIYKSTYCFNFFKSNLQFVSLIILIFILKYAL